MHVIDHPSRTLSPSFEGNPYSASERVALLAPGVGVVVVAVALPETGPVAGR